MSPRFKSEFLRQVPFALTRKKQRSWDGIGFFLFEFPILRRTRIKAGLERRFFYNLRDEGDLAPGDVSGDFRGTAAAYPAHKRERLPRIRTDDPGRASASTQRSLEVIGGDSESSTAGLGYMTVFAGLR